ncbi:hypothetical protein [Enterococcus faecium]
MNHFKGKQFQQDVIIVAVGYYLRYINGNNSLRYLEFREGAFDFQTSQQNHFRNLSSVI